MKVSSRPMPRRCVGQPGVLRKLPVLAVNRHEIARPHQIQHQPQLFHRPVSGNVQRRIHAAVHHVRAALREMVDHAEDRLLIARNDARTEHHRVARLDRDVFVVIHGHARERRHRLALRAGNQDRDLRRLRVHHVLRADQNAVGNVEQAVAVRDLGDRDHAAAHQRDLAAEFLREIEDQLQAVNRGAEAGDEQAAFGAVENVFQARAHGALGIGIAGPVGIGGIGEQQQHAALAVIGQRVQIEQFVVGGGGVDFEIAGVDDDAERGGDGQRHALTIECVTWMNSTLNGPISTMSFGLAGLQRRLRRRRILRGGAPPATSVKACHRPARRIRRGRTRPRRCGLRARA